MLNHVTYHVPAGTLDSPELLPFMCSLGFHEVVPNDPFEHGWKVRWWRIQLQTLLGVRVSETLVHLVEGESDFGTSDRLSLGHLCVSSVGASRLNALRYSKWCKRDSGSGRIWLEFANLRVEVRP